MLYSSALLIASAVLAAAAPAPPHYGTSYTTVSRVIGFGDSWTDNGNVYKYISNGTWPIVPPYYKGHFSNGKIWIEDLANALTGSSDALADFAYGAATTNNNTIQGYSGANSDLPTPSVNLQIANLFPAYLKTVHNSLGPNPLYAYWSGGNDYFFDFFGANNLAASKVTDDIAANIASLIAHHHARLIVVLNLPPLGALPFFSTLGASGAASSAHFAQAALWHNGNLTTSIRAAVQASGDTGAAVYVHDVFSLIQNIIADPVKNGQGITDAVNACLTNGTVVCDKPNTHLFWDNFHFTEKGHAIIGQDVYNGVREYLLKHNRRA
ncbi:hypothetical protein HK101_000915 [Irineochytrium annulatum]|nr:hypothetical protein HK101_000915 [Irineochytrium annulatum]